MTKRQTKNQKDPRRVELRDRIKAREIIDHLQDKLLNDQPITAVEVGAARLLLDRALPTLQSVEHQVQADVVTHVTIGIVDENSLYPEISTDRGTEEP